MPQTEVFSYKEAKKKEKQRLQQEIDKIDNQRVKEVLTRILNLLK